MYYYYEELKSKALAANATQSDIDSLGKWFLRFGDSFWNGESWTIDDDIVIKPVYKQDEDDDFILGYEIIK